jgi:hypothetical protein
MQAAVIAYRNGTLEARQQGDVWTVRLASLEARARYLDLALAELLGNASAAHRAAARLLCELEDVVEQQLAAQPDAGQARPRKRPRAPRRNVWLKPPLIGIRVVAFTIVAGTAFILTTWLSTLR